MVAKIQKPFRKKRTTRPLRKRRMVPTKALTNAVKQITLKAQETKVVQSNIIENQAIQGNGLDYDFNTDSYLGGGGKGNVLATAANMATGSQQRDRVGNEINVVSMTLKGFIRCRPFDGTTNTNRTPFDVYMVIYKKKNEPEGQTDKIVNYADGTKGKITGAISTTVLNPWNRDNYIIKKVMKFPMKAQPLINNNTVTDPLTTMPTSENGETSGSTRDYFRMFNVRVPIKKTLKFNGSSQSAPINDWFGVGFYYINGDATASTAIPANQIRAEANVQAILKFKDP